MDGAQRYIANADDRPADEIERADQPCRVVTQVFVETTDQAYIYTTDRLAEFTERSFGERTHTDRVKAHIQEFVSCGSTAVNSQYRCFGESLFRLRRRNAALSLPWIVGQPYTLVASVV